MKLPDLDYGTLLELRHMEKRIREFVLDEAMRGEQFVIDRHMDLTEMREAAHNRIKGLMRVIETCDDLMRLVSTPAKEPDTGGSHSED